MKRKKAGPGSDGRPAAESAPGGYAPEVVGITALRPHPRNYCVHPEDEIAHLMESIREHGLYRNVVVARDGTLLAGHGVVEACRRLGMAEVPVIRLDVTPDDPRALKVLAGDNEIAHLREHDDRALSELLRSIKESDDVGLLGTGFDEAMLANLIFVTRPRSEVPDFNAAAQWVGMPDYDPGHDTEKLIINFRSRADRDIFIAEVGLVVDNSKGGKSTWWPPRGRQDLKSVLVEG